MLGLGKSKQATDKLWARSHSSPLSLTRNTPKNKTMPLKKYKIKSAKMKKYYADKAECLSKRVFIIFGTDGDQRESCNGLQNL